MLIFYDFPNRSLLKVDKKKICGKIKKILIQKAQHCYHKLQAIFSEFSEIFSFVEGNFLLIQRGLHCTCSFWDTKRGNTGSSKDPSQTKIMF